jgi:hypothetical protein
MQSFEGKKKKASNKRSEQFAAIQSAFFSVSGGNFVFEIHNLSFFAHSVVIWFLRYLFHFQLQGSTEHLKKKGLASRVIRVVKYQKRDLKK